MQRNVSNIKYIEPSVLHQWITQNGQKTQLGQKFQVIDARGSDYIGGHIKGCWNYPYSKLKHYEEGEALMDEMFHKLETSRRDVTVETDNNIMNVVFHCAQSQQRGPAAAMKFLRYLPDDKLSVYNILILRGGFNLWQDLYGTDTNVTADYEPDLWSW
ncbi:hypothetical protein TPHA_0A04830 [Tetrapisispora phaffii CBS 4417]|uniref:Rhodanese domain-containing protein n=1 Tax=Tetrapisispora phaffii (strain ATCC 24235 / CBS 4417 / NBRC 1672 / NRRL Y-8282 / UCD 70-5) TaxID=1071381 RepID=G8BNT0_TETPH|nr:hypothetical protein TPHA_0A04830 [Tetrapisispora phaffii CBS 4417]CCE61558.1 hypothetical protein TPHA_0A04830 [Tetrapisispora phaffii CBS 4417]